MSQENTEQTLDLAGNEPDVQEETAAQQPPPGNGGLPPAVLEELQQLRQTNRMREEELHNLRVATLRSAAPQYDPVEAAYAQLQKDADPDAFKYIGPVVKPLLAELHAQRQLNAQLSENVNFLAQRDREREVHTQLAQLIPDLPKIGPQLLELVGKLHPAQQRLYADNPSLFVPLAESLRAGGATKTRAAARAVTTMDTGGGADRVIPTTADAISAMNPNGKEFAALQRSFYGGEV